MVTLTNHSLLLVHQGHLNQHVRFDRSTPTPVLTIDRVEATGHLQEASG